MPRRAALLVALAAAPSAVFSAWSSAKSKPKDSWTRVRCRLAQAAGATGATSATAGAAASATSRAALLGIFLCGHRCWLVPHTPIAL